MSNNNTSAVINPTATQTRKGRKSSAKTVAKTEMQSEVLPPEQHTNDVAAALFTPTPAPMTQAEEAANLCAGLGYDPKATSKPDHSKQRHTMPGTFSWGGVSSTALCRHLGSKGLNVAQCRKVLDSVGMAGVAKATIQTQRYNGSKGIGGKLPTFNAEQTTTLNDLIGQAQAAK
jgi:hypothetical protein